MKNVSKTVKIDSKKQMTDGEKLSFIFSKRIFNDCTSKGQ